MKIKRLVKQVAFISTAALISLGLSGCGSASTATNSVASGETQEAPAESSAASKDGSSTLDKDTLVVGLDDTFAPMGFKDESGEIVGFDIDLAKAVGEKLGKKIEFQSIDWSMKEADLKGKAVAAQTGSTAVTAMEKEPEVVEGFKDGKPVTYESNNDVLMDLEAGRVDAAVADEIIVRYYISKKGEDKYKILEDDFGDEEYGVGMRKGDTTMVDAFNKAYDELKQEGKVAEISTKWFGEDITC